MRGIIAAMGMLAASPAFATTVTLDLPGSGAPETHLVAYECGGEVIAATYINAGRNGLAVLKIGDATVVFSNVLSGSGARYAGQQYIWWTKGEQADLYDLTKGESAPPLHCKAGPAG
ncbi:MliC family protein [Mesorhizobium sp. BAC0120]|uniref:MliC family protein n=1 Tax=Mesorhizobium sp. BAC0120 TaxID=3090670 RepID=UPI00298C37CB|nr:MliC family protein [Mesorhizobium sp. BAC0120]MDW6025495.1 MliC family protein [Mesorhizobium sp. BAC0120]